MLLVNCHLDSAKEDSSVDFRKLHSDVCVKLSSLCEVWEGKENQLEAEANDDTPHLEDGELGVILLELRDT